MQFQKWEFGFNNGAFRSVKSGEVEDFFGNIEVQVILQTEGGFLEKKSLTKQQKLGS